MVDLATDALTTHKAASIDAIVFPELALRFDIYEALKARLKARYPELEIVISGLSDDGQLLAHGRSRKGNFVAVSAMPKGTPLPKRNAVAGQSASVADGQGLEDMMRPTVREKHHRWKLDHHQLGNYGLAGALNPKLNWWEDIDLLSRCVDFTVFRKSSVLAAMICEDLAASIRVKSCYER